MTLEVLTVANDRTPLDLLLFRRFRREVPGLVEATLARPENYLLAGLGAYPPPGTKVTVEIPAPAAKTNRPVISLFD